MRFVGVDPGIGGDPTGIVAVEYDGTISVLYAQRLFRPSDMDLKETIIGLDYRLKPKIIYCETNNRGDAFLERIRGLGVCATGIFCSRELKKPKPNVMSKRHMMRLIKSSRITFADDTPEIRELINQLNSIGSDGKAIKSRHDDLYSALLLCLHGVDRYCLNH